MDGLTTELSSVHDVKIAVCYMLDKLGRPVTEEQLYEIVLNSEVVNYFHYTEAFGELISSGAVSKKVIDGTEYVVLEDKGHLSAEYYNEFVPYHFRKRLLAAALSFFAKIKRQSDAEINVTDVDNGCEVECRIKDTDFDLMTLRLYAPYRDQEEVIKEKIILNTIGFYKKVISFVLDNTEEQFDIDVNE
jgi:hypothetical protein